VFHFKRHAACSFGDVPAGQHEAACGFPVSSTPMMDGGATRSCAAGVSVTSP
jgi:hypothetical protein